MNRVEKGIGFHTGEAAVGYLGNIKIGIAGAGGLGSNCAFNLVRCGFKKFIISDFDSIDFTNLNRQFYFENQVGLLKVEALRENLLRINPDIEIEIIPEKLEDKNKLSVFDDCDAVVEAFDKSIYKKMITEYFMNKETFFVAASGIAGCGSSDDIKVRKINRSFYIVGDMVSEVGVEKPPFSPYTNIAAAKQADIVFSHFYKKFKKDINMEAGNE